MDFFAHQDIARRRTGLLITLYLLAVASIITGIYLCLVSTYTLTQSGETIRAMCYLNDRTSACNPWWQPQLFFITFFGVSGVIVLASLYRLWTLRGGGSVVAESLGGRLLEPHTASDIAEKRLLNIVEEMAIASGCPVPPVYLLDTERAINAFCAGYYPEDSVFAVTRGALEELSREELQSVIAHEFSHLLNGDCRLNIRLIGILHGILALSIIGRFIMRSSLQTRRRQEEKGFPVALLGVILFSIGTIGLLFARLIKSAVSRQREFLADASAVQFTRNPRGLIGALTKVGQQQGQITHVRAEELSHMFFVSCLRSTWFSLLSTHPPLRRRIERLGGGQEIPEEHSLSSSSESRATSRHVSPEQLLARVGAFTGHGLTEAQGLLSSIPEPLLKAAHSPEYAPVLLVALVAADSLEARNLLDTKLPGGELRLLFETFSSLAATTTGAHALALLEISAPLLGRMDSGKRDVLHDVLTDCIHADSQISLFEFCFLMLVEKYLKLERQPGDNRLSVDEATHVVLSAFAHHCQPVSSEAESSYLRAAERLSVSSSPLSKKQSSFAHLSLALWRLTSCRPEEHRNLLHALTTLIEHDGVVSETEIQLFRTVSLFLGIPVALSESRKNPL